jgi:DNA-binding beta-propeller fold protein YncE
MNTTRFTMAVLGAALLMLPAAPAYAAGSAQTIATGLDRPRGIATGPHGEIYVAESGKGKAITVISAGRQRRSWGTAGVDGPTDVTVGPDGRLYCIGGSATLFRSGSRPVVLGDQQRNSTALAITDRGALLVDTGRRELLRVAARGRIATVAAFPERVGSIARGPDGAYYLGGQERVWRIVPGQAPRVYAAGFTGVVDLAWSADGRLYVLADGLLKRVDRKGKHRVVASDGLTASGGLAVRGNYAYVTNTGRGSVVRISLGN